jgi:hypothetical protein
MAYRNGPKIVTDGLVLCLDAAISKSYPGSGTTWYDLSTSKTNGNLINGTTFTNSNNGILNFDGTNDYINLGTNKSNLIFGNSNFAIFAWVYRFNTNTGCVICGQADLATATNSAWVFYVSSTAKSDVYIGNTGKGVFSPNPPINTWSYVGFVRNNENLLTYLNGSVVDSRSDLSTSAINSGSTTYPATIGGFATSINVLNGYMSSVVVYKNKIFSTQEIQQNYNATRGRFGV